MTLLAENTEGMHNLFRLSSLASLKGYYYKPQTGETMSDPNRFKSAAQDFSLKSSAQMREQWDGEFPEACDNTLRVVERVHVEFTEGRDLMPRFPVLEGESESSWLVKEVERGLQQRFPGGVPDTHHRQADYEVGVIGQLGYPGYFLVTADLVCHAKANGIRSQPQALRRGR